MNEELLRYISEINDITASINIFQKFSEILKKFLKIENITILYFDNTDFSYKIVDTTLQVPNRDEIYFFDAEIEIIPPFSIEIEGKEYKVIYKSEFEKDDSKYTLLIHSDVSIEQKILDSLFNIFLTAYKNRIIYNYYQNSLLNTQNQLNILNEIGDLLGNFNLNIILTKLLEHVNNIVKGDVATIFLYDKEQETLKAKVNWGVKEEYVLEIIDKNSGKPLVEKVYNLKEIKFYEDVNNSPEILYPKDKFVINSLISLPIYTNNENLGVLFLINFEIDESFIDIKLATLELLVKIAAIGIENSIFFEKSLEQEKINTQLRIAANIQNNLLPDNDFISENIKITGFSTPAMNVGGDFYNYMEKGNKIYAFLGDVSGKGIPAALLTTMAMIVIKTSIDPENDAKKIVENINNTIAIESLGENYLTLGFFEIDIKHNKAFLVNGGQEILYFKSDTNEINEFSSTNLPIGMFEDVEFNMDSIEFLKGDILITFSDGITDAVNTNGDSYGIDRLKKLIIENATKDAVELKNIILDDVNSFSKGADQFDDLTILLVKHT